MADITSITNSLYQELSKAELPLLSQASTSLSERYRQGRYGLSPLSKLERYAYVFARMPATISAITQVLAELKRRMPAFKPSSLTDIGAGPGSASWAALDIFDSLEQFTLIEQDPEWIALGQKLGFTNPSLSKAEWQQKNIIKNQDLKHTNLLIAAYCLQEISKDIYTKLIDDFFKQSDVVVIIEPGTPKGFDHIRAVRAELIRLKAHIIAPCTHEQPCPIQGSDWCHFSARLRRDHMHRRLKDGSLAFEDEKYAYIIAAREPETRATGRVVRSPIKRSGHIIIDMCTQEGLKREIVSRSDKEHFRAAKKLEWGDLWHPHLDRYTLTPDDR